MGAVLTVSGCDQPTGPGDPRGYKPVATTAKAEPVASVAPSARQPALQPNSPADSQAVIPTTTDNADTAYVLETATRISESLVELKDLQGKFSGFDTLEGIARHSNARELPLWSEFASAFTHSMPRPVGYRTMEGDFVSLIATSATGKVVGLVINLNNQQSAFHTLEVDAIASSGDPRASALGIVLEYDSVFRTATDASSVTPADLRARTTAELRTALSKLEGGGDSADSSRQLENPPKIGSDEKDDYAGAVAAQNKLIALLKDEVAAKERDGRRAQAMERRLIEILYAVFEDAKKSGLRLSDPLKQLAEVNVARRRVGVWELIPEPYKIDPKFIVVRDFSRTNGHFVIEGVGLVTAFSDIKDLGFSSFGIFSEDCQVQITYDSEFRKYGCVSFYEGNHDKEVFEAIRASIISRVKSARAT